MVQVHCIGDREIIINKYKLVLVEHLDFGQWNLRDCQSHPEIDRWGVDAI